MYPKQIDLTLPSYKYIKHNFFTHLLLCGRNSIKKHQQHNKIINSVNRHVHKLEQTL